MATTLLGLTILIRRIAALSKQPLFRIITLLGGSVVISSMIAFYYLERAANPKVHSFFDALYWGIATITTVGSDISAVTVPGRIVAMVMMVTGALFLLSYTALFAGVLLRPEIEDVEREVKELEKDVPALERELEFEDRRIGEAIAELESIIQDLRSRRQGRRKGPADVA